MADFYSNFSQQQQQQQQQQQGQQSSSYYGNTTTTNNTTNNNSNTQASSSPYGQSTSEPLQTTAGQESSWQPSSFAAAAASSTTTAASHPQQQYQYQPSNVAQQQQQQQPSSQQPTHHQHTHQPVNPYNATPAPAPTQPIGGINPATTPTPPPPLFWNPALATSLATTALSSDKNAIMDMGLMQGQKFLDEGFARMIPGLERAMMGLRVYFAVNNVYVKRKMGRVLFPFLKRDWRRLTNDPSDITNPTYALPASDDNALDLYIPTMSLITYVLLCALCYGSAGQFDPEVLPNVITSCILTQIFEVVLFRIGLYTMQASVPILDLLAITGYKYLGLAMNMLVGVVLEVSLNAGSKRGYFVAFLWTASAISFFVLKTMAEFVPKVTSRTGPKRELMIVGFGVSQFATMWFLGQTKFLN